MLVWRAICYECMCVFCQVYACACKIKDIHVRKHPTPPVPTQEAGRFGNQWHQLNATTHRVNAVDPAEKPLSVFERCCGLLVPLYAARATEEVFYGKEGVTTSTSTELSTASEDVGVMCGNSVLVFVYGWVFVWVCV